MRLPSKIVGLSLLGLVVWSACAPGNARFTAETPAGFWVGLWHGIIALITFVIGLFDDNVHMYERANNGSWYDAGFFLGFLIMAKGGHSGSQMRRKPKCARDTEWEDIGDKVEAKIRRKIRDWAEADPDASWDEVEAKAESKLKGKLRAWAESDGADKQPASAPSVPSD